MALKISPRELEVGTLVCDGVPSHEIAARLGLGLTTVLSHRTSLRLKLRARNTAELMGAMILEKLWRPKAI